MSQLDQVPGNFISGGAPSLEVRISGHVWQLERGQSLTVGRHETDVLLDDLRVSGRHLTIRWDNGWVAEDAASRNGTFLERQRVQRIDVTDRVALHLGAADGPEVGLRTIRQAPVQPQVQVQMREEKLIPPPPPVYDVLVDLTDASGPAAPPVPPVPPVRNQTELYLGRSTPARQPNHTQRLKDLIGKTWTAGPYASPLFIGRDESNSVTLHDPLASRFHARLYSLDGTLVVEDLASANGTFINGTRITRSSLLAGDRLTVGNTDFIIGERFTLRVDIAARETGLKLINIGYCLPNGKRLLRDVDLDTPAGSLITVIGPSGAGKSTLMNVLTGLRKPTDGRAMFEGQDIHAEYDSVRTRIGLVPQQDVIHTQLSTREALLYGAKLRLPADTTKTEREQRVDEVMATLGLTGHAQTQVKLLSGGQRKRASVGLELLTEPSLLVLDEPTSGLDPNTARDLMAALRDIANEGRTVVVVTHSPADLDQCDSVLLLAAGGLPAALGSREDVLEVYGTDDWRDVYKQVSWEGGDPEGEYVKFRDRTPRLADRPDSRHSPSVKGAKPHKLSVRDRWIQTTTVAARQTKIMIADRGYLAFLLVLPVILGLLALIVPGDRGFGSPGTEATQLLVILVLGSTFAGLAMSIRDLIGERPIFRREYAVGLSPMSYLIGKCLVFFTLGAIQSALLTLTVIVGKPGPSAGSMLTGLSALDLFIVVCFVTWAATAIGLLISAFVTTNDQVMPLLVVAIMAQLVLCGGLVQITGRTFLDQVSWIIPARWGFAAEASVVNLPGLRTILGPDALWDHRLQSMVFSLGMLTLLGTLTLLLTWFRLTRERAK